MVVKGTFVVVIVCLCYNYHAITIQLNSNHKQKINRKIKSTQIHLGKA